MPRTPPLLGTPSGATFKLGGVPLGLTHNQMQILLTLQEHADAGGEAIGSKEIAREADRRRNRWFGYDQLHSSLKGMQKRGLVKRTAHKPARWEITDAGREALAQGPRLAVVK